MTKKICSLFVISFLLSMCFSILLLSCKAPELPDCEIKVCTSYDGKVSVDKTTAKLGDFVTVTIEPDPGYKFGGFGYKTKYMQDENNPNIYYVFVNKTELNLYPEFDLKTRYDITENYNSNCGSIKCDAVNYYRYYEAYEGKVVTFTLTPNDHYCFDKDEIKVYKKNNPEETINIEETDEKDAFSFVMPEADVEINVNFKYEVSIVPEKTTYKLGENIVYNVTDNRSGKNNFDVYIDYCCYSNYKMPKYINSYKKNVDISSGKKIEIDSNELGIGNYKLYIANVDDDDYYELDNQISIETEDLEEGWTSLGLYISNFEKDNDSVWGLLRNTDINKKTINYKYYFKSNTEKIYESKLYNDGNYDYNVFMHDLVYDNPTTAVIYVYDEKNKLISNKIEVEIQIYETLLNKKTEKYYYDDLGVGYSEFCNSIVTAEEGTEEYFTLEKDSSYLTITFLKPTKIPRKIYIKDTDENILNILTVTIDYYGSITLEEYTEE